MTSELYSGILWTALFLLATAAVGVLAVIARRRLPLLGAGRRLALVERLELGDRRFLALVRWDHKELLLSGSPERVEVVDQIDVPHDSSTATEPEVAQPARIGILRLRRRAQAAGESFAAGGGR